jgi:hypothetical protein
MSAQLAPAEPVHYEVRNRGEFRHTPAYLGPRLQDAEAMAQRTGGTICVIPGAFTGEAYCAVIVTAADHLERVLEHLRMIEGPWVAELPSAAAACEFSDLLDAAGATTPEDLIGYLQIALQKPNSITPEEREVRRDWRRFVWKYKLNWTTP